VDDRSQPASTFPDVDLPAALTGQSASELAADVSAVDPDLALLEGYLDGELTPAERSMVERRLAAEPNFSDALSRLSAEYAIRRAVWTGYEGTPAQAARVAGRVQRAVQARSIWPLNRRWVGWASAAAACLVCFAAGWVGRGTSATAAPPQAAQPADPVLTAPVVYQVAITDEEGNITAVQKFESLQDAQAFAADLSRWQARQVQLQNGQPVLVTSGL
jgi:hypothetical protein